MSGWKKMAQGFLHQRAAAEGQRDAALGRLELVRSQIQDILDKEGMQVWCPGYGEEPVLCLRDRSAELEMPQLDEGEDRD